MKIDQYPVGSLQGFRSQTPLAYMTKHFLRDPVCAVAHCYNPQIGSMSDDRCNEHGDGVSPVRHLLVERTQLFGETAQIVDFQQ